MFEGDLPNYLIDHGKEFENNLNEQSAASFLSYRKNDVHNLSQLVIWTYQASILFDAMASVYTK